MPASNLRVVLDGTLLALAPAIHARLRRRKGLEPVVRFGEQGAAVTERENLDPEYCRGLFARYGGFAPERGRVLEIGPGASSGTLALFADRGLECVALDAFAWRVDPADEQRLYEALGVGPITIERVLAPASELPFPDDHFDLVYTHAVLEHVERPGAVVRELARVLAPGGVTAHCIDLHDHQHREEDPLRFLRVPGWIWGRLFRGTELHQNQWRSCEWERAFAASFAEVEVDVQARIEPPSGAARRALARPWRTMDPDRLAETGIVLVARHPPPGGCVAAGGTPAPVEP